MNRAKRTEPEPTGGSRSWAGTTPPPVDRILPGEGQESVWDYPRPPRVEPVAERIRVTVDGITIADSVTALRVVETAGAPVYYLPPGDVRLDLMTGNGQHSVCEYKGLATYHDLIMPGRTIANAAWSYDEPASGYQAIRGFVAFFAGRVDEAWVGDELATPQHGGFYGGWVTSRVVGPIKGGPGTLGW